MDWCGVLWCAWCGAVRCGVVGVVWCGVVYCVMVAWCSGGALIEADAECFPYVDAAFLVGLCLFVGPDPAGVRE